MHSSYAHKDKLGFYLVGWKKFYSKALALIESTKTGYDPIWVFNDDVYSNINWSIPINTPLLELYKRRAQQIREKYDRVVLFYSGGADSTNVLHAFVDNNIFIDEILIEDLKIFHNALNDKDYSSGNFFSELEFAARAHLKKIKNNLNPNTKITVTDFSERSLEVLEKDYWIEECSLNQNVTITGILRQISQDKNEFHLNLIEKGKTCAYVLGIDKPMVYYNGTDYFCYFLDVSAYHYASPQNFNTKVGDASIFTEFFYWTPDMPEIVVKQAQELKNAYEANPSLKLMAMQSLSKHISEYRQCIHPIIYPDYVIEPFQTKKPESKLFRPMDNWFWQTASEKVKKNYLNSIKSFGQQINPKYAVENNFECGLSYHRSKFYKL